MITPPRRPIFRRNPPGTPCVLLPSYRGGEYLKAALDSLAAQTTDWYLILLDTSGEGRTERVFATYPDSFKRRVRFEHFPPHDDAGTAAHHHLLDVWGGGGPACWLHDDDAFHPDRLKTAIDYLDAHRDVDVAFSGHAHCDEHLRPTGRVTYVTPEKWGWTRDSYRPIGMASAMMRPRVLEITEPYEDIYVSGIQDCLVHAYWWVRGLVVHSIPDSPHYLRRKHDGEYGNTCAANVSRLGASVVQAENERLEAAFAALREPWVG